jgi:cell wall-associated NlpC family hydrolase
VSRLLLIGAAAVLLLPVLVISAGTGGIAVAAPTETAATTIPPEYLALYEQAGIVSGLPWQLLAGVGKVECDHGQNPDPSCTQEGVENKAGAGGPMQFLASTWATYGLDADNDGQADRWDPVDAIFSAANYLKASGAPGNDEAALYAYNHSETYVQQVLAWAGLYAEADPGSTTDTTAATTPNVGTASGASPAAQAAVAYALAQLGTPYRWGGDGPGGFDCSGLVQAAYASAGVELPRVAQAQYDAGPPIPAGQPLEPGDLIFFGSSPTAVEHVGIVVNPAANEMVDAPHTGAVVRLEPYSGWGDLVGVTRPASAEGAGR